MSTTLVIPDLHCPFQHDAAFSFLADVKRLYHPDKVVCIGDEIDQAALGRFPRDPDGLSAGHELEAAREALRRFYGIFTYVYVCESNHTWRVYKRAFEAGLPRAALLPVNKLLKAPKGWKWASEWVLDDVLFLHGDGLSGKDANRKACERHRCNVAIGHLHSNAGVYYSRTRTTVWGLSVGCLINERAYSFQYAKNTIDKPVLGCGVIKDGVPHFVPLQ